MAVDDRRVRRAVLAGTLGWLTGLFGAISGWLVTVDGPRLLALARLPEAYAEHLLAHGVGAVDALGGGPASTTGASGVALVVAVLVGCGAVLAVDRRTARAAVRTGASVTLGYGLCLAVTTLTLVGLFAGVARSPPLVGHGIGPRLAGVLLVAGVLTPVILGGVGGLVGHALTRRLP